MGYLDKYNTLPDITTLDAIRAQQQQTQQVPQPKKKGILSSLISEAGGLGGATAGGAIGSAILPGLGTILGAGIGGFLGGTGGRVVENKVRDNRIGIGDALKEGAVTGVLSAGPLKLGKLGYEAAAGAKAGVPLAEALANAGTKAAAFAPIRNAVGKKLTSSGEGAITKAIGLTKVQKNSLLKDTGETAGKIARKYGIFDASGVQAAKDGLFGEFDAAVKKIGAIPKSEVEASLKTRIASLAGQLPSDKRAMAKSLQQEAAGLLKGLGDTIDAGELNAIKGQFDSLVNYTAKQADPNKYGVNKRVADSIREVLQKAADANGIKSTNGLSLKDIGLEIRKLDKLGVQAAKNVEGAGGTSVLGLRNLIGGGALAGAGGGVPGLAVGMASTALANNQGVRKLGAKGVVNLGEKLATNKAGIGLGGIVARQGIGSLLKAGDQSSKNIQSNSDNGPSMMNPQNSVQNMPNQYTENNGLSSNAVDNSQQNDPFAPENVQGNIAKIVASGGGLKDISGYLDIVKTVQSLQPQSKPLNSTAAGTVTDLQNGIQNIRNLSDRFATSSANKPLVGELLAGNPFNTDGQSMRADIARVKQVIGKALEGGVLRKEDEAKYAKILPTLNDTDAVAQQKITAIADDLQRKLYLYQQNSQGGQSDLSSLLAAYGQ